MSALAARLGDTLLARGWLDADQLDIAQAEVRAGRPLEQALAQLGFVPDGVLRDTLAELLGLDSLEARALVADSTALAVVPAHWARQLRILPLRYAPANQTLTIASARPADLRAHDQLVAASQGQVARVHVQLADEADILQALDRAYGAPDTLSAVLTEWRSGQQDEPGDVAVDLVCGQPRGEPLANEQPAQKRHRKRLDQPVHHQRDANAAHVLAHFAQRGKVHLHQHRNDHHPDQHTHGQIDLGDFHAPDGLERAGPQLPQPNAHHDAQHHPHGEIALEHAHGGGGVRGG